MGGKVSSNMWLMGTFRLSLNSVHNPRPLLQALVTRGYHISRTAAGLRVSVPTHIIRLSKYLLERPINYFICSNLWNRFKNQIAPVVSNPRMMNIMKEKTWLSCVIENARSLRVKRLAKEVKGAPPKLTTWVQSPGPPQWKERTRLSLDLCMCTAVCASTHI